MVTRTRGRRKNSGGLKSNRQKDDAYEIGMTGSGIKPFTRQYPANSRTIPRSREYFFVSVRE
jgi:hypothetical protein